MSNVLKNNITLRQQPNWVIYNQSPNAAVISEKSLQVDSSEYEDYTFTGNLDEIIAQESSELSKGNSNRGGLVSGTTDTYYHGRFVTTTRTRLEGDIWQLQVRVQRLFWRNPEEQTATPQEIQQQKEKMGDEESPGATFSTSAIQQSILFHPAYKEFNAVQLGAIKRYMTGVSPGTLVPNVSADGTSPGPNEPSVTMKQWLENLGGNTALAAEFALKNPVYYVPSTSVTLTYFKESPSTKNNNVGEIVNEIPSNPKLTVKPGYQIRFMGSSSAKTKGGYRITENYVIGDFESQSPAWYTPPTTGK